MSVTPEFTFQLVSIMAGTVHTEDVTERLMWHRDKDTGDLTVSINCSDLFEWATCDSEPVETDDDLDLLLRCITECYQLSEKDPSIIDTAVDLYCARKRGRKPQVPAYKFITATEIIESNGAKNRVDSERNTARLRAMFDDCERVAA